MTLAGVRRFLRRNRPHVTIAACAAGLAASPHGARPIIACLLLALATAVALDRVRTQARILVVAAALGGVVAGAARIEAIDRPARAAPPGSAIQARATLLEHARDTRFGRRVPMRIDSGPARGLRVMAHMDFDIHTRAPMGPGLRVQMRALVTRTKRDGDFDYAAFLRSRAIGREVQVESLRDIGRRGGVAGAIDSVRHRAELGITAGLGPARAALARGMVLGEDGAIADDVRDDFQRSGLAHLLAASGQNVALLCALALPLLMLAGTPARVRIAVMLVLVALYVPLAGSGASIQRAGIMAGAGLVAIATGRRSSAAYALLLAAALTLALNPRATGDPGWQLSFAAVGGMLALGPPIRRQLSGLPRPLAEPVGVTVAATLSTAPLMAHQFGAISIAALPANLLALPAVAPVMWIGMVQGSLGQLGALALPLCALAGHASGLGLAWVAAVARRLADPAWAQAAVRLGSTGTLAAYACLAIAALLLQRAPRIPPARETIGIRWRAAPPAVRRAIACAVAGAALLAAVAHARPPAPPRHLTVDFLDVGQGDATLIRDPSGAAVLFDAGPPEARVDRTLRRLGVRRLSALVATHQSRDHHGGLLRVIERFQVGLLLDGGDGTRDPTFTVIEREADRRGIRRIPTRAGEDLRIGSLRIRILSPGPRAPGPAPADPNPRATIAIVSSGAFDLFLSADAESPYALPLRLPRVEAMKVPHHGSADDGLPQLLARLRPVVATIEVGTGNPFGHPRASTVRALAARVPNVFRTDRDGTVELTVEPSGLHVRRHR